MLNVTYIVGAVSEHESERSVLVDSINRKF